MAEVVDVCPNPIRVDGPAHSWRFDGDDPYIICAGCNEMRDAITGRVIRPAAGSTTAPVADEPTPTNLVPGMEPLHEVQCPSCSATIRARMADGEPAELAPLADRLVDAALAAAQLGYHGVAGTIRDLAAAVADDGAGSHRELDRVLRATLDRRAGRAA